ncbi:hypothetical protein E2C01_057190 [Portunus trituberculatus]|uniref:Uncharacterized protein n=1 Tax=Portunus trituberculatus TaxID=210409 RepID=A0A5B7H0E2_PORTR|nr:hypothetical protein [Portunus trituberculatus]
MTAFAPPRHQHQQYCYNITRREPELAAPDSSSSTKARRAWMLPPSLLPCHMTIPPYTPTHTTHTTHTTRRHHGTPASSPPALPRQDTRGNKNRGMQLVDCLPTKGHFGDEITGGGRRNVIFHLTNVVVNTDELRHGACHRQSAALLKNGEIPLEQRHCISSLTHCLTTTGVVSLSGARLAEGSTLPLGGRHSALRRRHLTPPSIKLNYPLSLCSFPPHSLHETLMTSTLKL